MFLLYVLAILTLLAILATLAISKTSRIIASANVVLLYMGVVLQFYLSEKRLSSIKSFDMMACSDASLEDLDLPAIKNLYLPKAIAEDILADDDRSLKEQLASLRLYDREKDCPTNAAVLLFGKNTKYFFPGAYIQYVLFDGLDNAADILNQNEFRGS